MLIRIAFRTLTFSYSCVRSMASVVAMLLVISFDFIAIWPEACATQRPHRTNRVSTPLYPSAGLMDFLLLVCKSSMLPCRDLAASANTCSESQAHCQGHLLQLRELRDRTRENVHFAAADRESRLQRIRWNFPDPGWDSDDSAFSEALDGPLSEGASTPPSTVHRSPVSRDHDFEESV